jgi:hypothetical protein
MIQVASPYAHRYSGGMVHGTPKVAKAIPYDELLAMFLRLAELTGAERSRLAAKLANPEGPTWATLREMNDQGMYEAKQLPGMTYEKLAGELGLKSRSNVTDGVARHRAKLAVQAAGGRKPRRVSKRASST